MHREIAFSREELFERVWSTPLLSLAKEIGVSDVAIGKACRRAGIPLPGRGYWAQDAKSRSPRPRLPKAREGTPERVSFSVAADEPLARRPRANPDRHPIEVSETLENPHRLVAATRSLARSAKVRDDGRVDLDFKRALALHVSPTQIDRALCIMDALIKASEAEGARWRVDDSGSTQIVWTAEAMKVTLSEKLTKRELPPPEPPKRRVSGRWEPNWDALHAPRFEWVSTGTLSFRVDEYVENYAQRTWNDTATGRLEEKLADVLAGFPAIAEGIKAKREKHEAWQRDWDEQQRRQREQARAAEVQRRLRVDLVRATTAWERAMRLRSFCDVVERAIAAWPDERRAQGHAWLTWAREQADRLDPSIDRLGELVAMKVALPDAYSGPHSWDRVDDGWWAGKE